MADKVNIRKETFDDKSYWLGESDYVEGVPLSGDLEADFAVVGGGFSGLSAAYHLKEAEPSSKVVVLESQVIGYGASGRNGGFSMPLMGYNISYLRWRMGDEKARLAHKFMIRSVDHVAKMVEKHDLKCDHEMNGLLVLARNKAQAKRLEKDALNYRKLGVDDVEFLDQAAMKEKINSAKHIAAIREPKTAILNPAKLAREMKRVVEEMGVSVYERTPVTNIGKKDAQGWIKLKTPSGTVSARKIVVATNAYSKDLSIMKNRYVPVWTYIVLTEPLTESQLASIGWRGREGVEDRRNLIHYFRLTADNRIAFGGHDAPYYYGSATEGKEAHAKLYNKLRRYMLGMFPGLKGVNFTHSWGGPVAATLEFFPTLKYLHGSRDMVFSGLYCGHGVSLSNASGMIVRDMLLEKDSELTKLPFVMQTVYGIPPEPVRYPFISAYEGMMKLLDGMDEILD